MKKFKFNITFNKIKKYLSLCILFICLLTIFACQSKHKEDELDDNAKNTSSPSNTLTPTNIITPPEELEETISTEVDSFLDKKGSTMDTRIQVPAGYIRQPSSSGELTHFLRNLTLKEDGSDVLLYDGQPKSNQDAQIAVFDFDIGSKDLQQCADSIMRVYAEYYWSIKDYDSISFHLTNGFLMPYTKWRDGNRIVVDGNNVSWTKSKSYDDSYEEFRNYLEKVFIYAGTLSLSEESEPIPLEDIKPGDMFLKGGSPGHCVLVVDAAIDQNGNQCFLLAQGYMPAQDFHILKNPLHPADPWYYSSEITYPFETPQWTFDEGSLMRWSDFKLNEEGITLDFSQEAVPAMAVEINPPKEASSSVNLLAVGDNLIHIQVIESGQQEDGTYNYDHLYSNLKEMISAADIAVINQETILGGDDFAYTGYPNFNSPTEIGDAVVNAGFDVVLHATNHTMDKGYKAFQNTLDYWKKHPQIRVLGINETEEDSTKIQIIEKNGIKIAMLNYTYSLNGHEVPKDKPYLVNMLDKKKMEEDIQKAEEEADFTIVFPHWGTEYVYAPTKTQKNLTTFFYEQGVDLIVGTHPHVLEPVEWIETNPGQPMLVYYSLGNFISYQREAPRMLGGIAHVTITKDSRGTYISDSSITPIVTHYENGPEDYNYGLFRLSDYTSDLSELHGVSELAKNGSFTYEGTYDLAKEILGTWFTD